MWVEWHHFAPEKPRICPQITPHFGPFSSGFSGILLNVPSFFWSKVGAFQRKKKGHLGDEKGEIEGRIQQQKRALGAEKTHLLAFSSKVET